MPSKKTSTATTKSTTKKTAASNTKASSTSKTTKPVKATVKQTKAKKPTTNKTIKHKSFRISKPTESFLTPRFTIETIYWIILGMAVLALGFWIASLQIRINTIYDHIEENQAKAESIDEALRIEKYRKAQSEQPAAE